VSCLIDLLDFILDFSAICILIVIVVGGLKLLHAIFNLKIPKTINSNHEKEEDNQIEQDSKEDSQGDGLVLLDDPLFPEELDKDEE
jgi:hypothetical protein